MNIALRQNFAARITWNESFSSWSSGILITGLLFFIIQCLEKTGIFAVFFGLFAMGVILLAVKPRIGILFYISVCLLSTDTPSVTAIEPLVSIHTISIGKFALMPLWTSFVLFFLLSKLCLRKEKAYFIPHFDKIMLKIGLLFLIAGAIGIPNMLEAPRFFISDSSYYINMATAYLSVRMFFRRKEDLKKLIMVIFCCLIVWAFAGVIFYILGIGAITHFLVQPIMDSNRVLFPLLVLFGLASYCMKENSLSYKIKMIIIALIGTFNVLTYASRGNMILLILGVILLLFLIRWKKRNNLYFIKKLFGILILLLLFITITFFTMNYLRPGSLNYIAWKMNSVKEISLFNSGMRKISSAEVRWLSFLNIIAHLWNNGNILWGVGLGGYFSDNYIPFAKQLLGGSAFQNEWILQNKLYKPHGTQLVILLKMGVLGIFAYFSLLLIYFVRSWKASIKLINIASWYSICTACISILPLLYYKNFISKIQIFMGLIMAIIANIIALFRMPAEKNSNAYFTF